MGTTLFCRSNKQQLHTQVDGRQHGKAHVTKRGDWFPEAQAQAQAPVFILISQRLLRVLVLVLVLVPVPVLVLVPVQVPVLVLVPVELFLLFPISHLEQLALPTLCNSQPL
jgi:hypothetical protein